MACGSKGIASPVVPTDFEAGDGIALDGCNPVVISTSGHSFLVDELGNKLTDEAGVPLEGKDTIDANLLVNTEEKVVKVSSTDSVYVVCSSDNVIEVTIDDTDINILLLALTNVKRRLLIIRNNTGSGTGTLTTTPNGSEKLKEPGGVLISSKTIDGDGDSLELLGVNSAHYNII